MATPTTPPGGVCFGLSHDRAGAGQAVHAPDLHAGGADPALEIHTEGGVDVRTVCPLTSLLELDCGSVCAPAVPFSCGVGQ